VSAPAERFAEAGEYVEVVRRSWDSWEDGAEIRDAETKRFFAVEKVHRIGFEGAHFRVVGPSITPRSPQAQPIVATRVDGAPAAAFAARHADVAFVSDTPVDGPLSFADVVVFLDADRGAAQERRARLDALATPDTGAHVFTGTPAELAELLLDHRAGAFRLHPGARPHDLRQITRALVPELQARNAFRRRYEAGTLRGLLGLPRPANRFVTT
jgi:alkanesulfonate monooxygenase SsuD/methylene tetrahydromethanopterin reductase-like flavin-dependent oxidoreductase (luciferase family)